MTAFSKSLPWRLIAACAGTVAAMSLPVWAQDDAKSSTALRAAPNSAYIVQMAEMPASAYGGDIKGYQSTKPNKGQKINPNHPAVVSYMSYLTSRHDTTLAGAGGGRKHYSYGYVYNGFAADLTPDQAARLAQMPGAEAHAAWLLPLNWPMAFLLAAILAPTDPVLASDVQTRSEHDRDALRLSLTVEGALNDGTAFPLVMLALGWLGLHELGANGLRWIQVDLLWSVGAGVALGVACGRAIGWALLRRLRAAPDSQGDELIYLGAIALVYGLSLALYASAFLAVFACGATLLRQHPASRAEPEAVGLGQHLQAFGARCERLAEVLMVLLIGAALTRVTWSVDVLLFALGLVLLVRPASVLLGLLPPKALPTTQRRLLAWFGIRGVGSLFYLAFVLERGVSGPAAQTLISACLVCLAVSIALHGVSATPLMRWYQRRRAPVKAP